MAKHERAVNFSTGITMALNAREFLGMFFFNNIFDGH